MASGRFLAPAASAWAVPDDDRHLREDRIRHGASRDAEVGARTRIAAALATVGVVLGLVLDTWGVPRDLGVRAAADELLAGAGLLTWLVLAHPRSEGFARWIALALVVCTAVALAWLTSLAPAEIDVFVGVFSASMLASALLVPWGPGPQLLASAALVLAYVWLPDWERYTTEHAWAIVMALADGFVVSVIGAYAVDRARWVLFVEREHVTRARDQAVREREAARRVARERALLLRASRSSSSTCSRCSGRWTAPTRAPSAASASASTS